ncbi:MAG: division/cell wall cluster transcriptional repressor MraZ [candidate division Zixibacteria bacterium]|nr:division/cell wall cluster transcriptional repressor MraZ [candidate division Zixibacteria bacterium]
MPESEDISNYIVGPGRWSFGFNGQYRHSLDEKGRLSVPANFRRDAAGNAIARFKLTVGFERCLFLFPSEYWQAVVEPQLLQLTIMEAEARLVTRMLLSRAADCEPDRQGRIMVPAPLRQYAGLDTEAIVNGIYTRVEIWNVDKWLAYESEAEAAFEETAARYKIRF